MANRVIESAEFIHQNSQDVSIPAQGIESAAIKILQEMISQKYDPSKWKDNELHPKENTEATVNWIFFLDLMNFSFFSDNDIPYAVSYTGKKYTGYWSLCAAINRALDEGVPITSPQYMCSASEEELENVFRSDTSTKISFLQERISAIKHAGKVLCEKFDGSFVNCIKQTNKSCQRLIDTVVENFPTFRDEYEFCDRKVYIYKRVQILVADLWACFEGQSYGGFHDIATITMFADYRVPQALLHFNLLSYSPTLYTHLTSHTPIPAGHPYEIEIRGNSIWSIELVKNRMIKLIENGDIQGVKKEELNAILIDFFVWDYAKRHSEELEKIPIHRTRTMFY
ncbi:hypothetical protein BKA69DRAFT_1176863 [Paraphysoderma sedebokerense]|nr:hypothetical protein BKA69DRAFT_1176863 [Paraphysoderma sedebokerense]